MLIHLNHWEVADVAEKNMQIVDARIWGKAWYVTDNFSAFILFADNEQDALDEAADRGILDTLRVPESEDYRDDPDVIRLGNESAPFSCDFRVEELCLPMPLATLIEYAANAGYETLQEYFDATGTTWKGTTDASSKA
jgi:hypothetical protein